MIEPIPQETRAATLELTGLVPRILVVDDIADNVSLLCRRLGRHGFETLSASDSTGTFEILERENVDLILLDAMMPLVSGIEILTRLRRARSASDLPVIMVTSMAQSEDIANALSIGANDYVTKPIDFTVLLARIKAHLETKRAQESLRLANLTLEQRVAHRTEALTMANEFLAREIDERRESESRMRHMAYHDALTGLPNRVLFAESLVREVDRAKTSRTAVGVFCIDLDGFKEVNDEHGHPFGDEFLRCVAERIVATAPESATVARLGGDEFAVIAALDDGSAGILAMIAESLIAGLQQPFEIGETTVHVGACIGISAFPCDGAEPEHLLKKADTALYRAKSEGSGVFRVFAPTMNTELEQRRGRSRELRYALERNQLELHYQPLVSLSSRRPIGFEALLRWRHPLRGLVKPGEFIAMAEETGLILPLGEWVLKAACLDAVTWPDKLKVAVNLSALHFRRSGIVKLVAGVIEETRIDPSRLEIEVTESVLLSNSREVLNALRGLRALGVSVSLDDFGTGFSALSYLLEFQFDKIKIDQSFVAGLGLGPRADSIVSAVVALAAGLDVTSLAEGVETEEQAVILLAAGCRQGQGHLFGKPMPVADVADYVAAARSPGIADAA